MWKLVVENLFVEVAIVPPLESCFETCSTLCEIECCGTDAISCETEIVENWSRKAGVDATYIALGQLKALLALAEDTKHEIGVEFLNAHTNGNRDELVAFLKAFENSLQQVAQSHPL